jgi:hypothetical protein
MNPNIITGMDYCYFSLVSGDLKSLDIQTSAARIGPISGLW